MTDGSGCGRVRIGVSSCLLGEAVRFDGGHCRNRLLAELAEHVEYVPFCPEMAAGLGSPRESLRLVRKDEAGVRLLGNRSGADRTASLRDVSRDQIRRLRDAPVAGYIVKKDSPTCGFERVRVYDENGVPSRNGRGVFTAALLRALPLLPVEDEGRLNDDRLREHFFERVFAAHRLQMLFRGEWAPGDLVRFHAAEKLLLLAHDPERYRRLGRLVARAGVYVRENLEETYIRTFLQALACRAAPGRHANVLQHMAGYFRDRLTGGERGELALLIRDYRDGLVPLIVPVTLVRHYVRKYEVTYLAEQSYLCPHPYALGLRNYT